jgi:hypothetical protein
MRSTARGVFAVTIEAFGAVAVVHEAFLTA